ncbi:hypothetical protein A0J57_14630 [Sphingobium sp. 22B]|jgi:hypothetical protein|uniref:Uncharacterized protein n=1 Tax=Sphingobium chungbukense TaxID=56193 RepID=A0A0M3AIE7_9SPHN|nr:hypothetical protein C100_06390 [Sphingobium sp. C100]KKW89753.1 hypothetical protein YP76_23300 [Sphingobium chungbukense]KXU30057.1 hypothetical protein AXW74_19850 [Sphingobium sp. AM]KYC31674.1 hypothetical protein A0J57_14630 [Sphingobium sp. 22B]OAP30919.1 hypothetical protein A8O16_16425 [Sphingobium sp. 20006FA]PNQ03334.1 hypothetical protein A8G00_11700 [Sphingobium sp. SA916]
MDDEAGLIGEFPDDFDGHGGSVADAIAVVGAVGEDMFNARVALARLLEQRHSAIAILHLSAMDQQGECPARACGQTARPFASSSAWLELGRDLMNRTISLGLKLKALARRFQAAPSWRRRRR